MDDLKMIAAEAAKAEADAAAPRGLQAMIEAAMGVTHGHWALRGLGDGADTGWDAFTAAAALINSENVSPDDKGRIENEVLFLRATLSSKFEEAAERGRSISTERSLGLFKTWRVIGADKLKGRERTDLVRRMLSRIKADRESR